MRIDNDRTKGLAAPFVILAHVRTGGTFMAHALSNHPQVYCDRGETLHHLSAWRQAGVDVGAILATIWGQAGYHAAGFRAIYRQAFHPKVWPLILSRKPKIIHLVRENVTRQGVSFGYQQLVRQGVLPFHPVHSFEERAPEPAAADPAQIVGFAAKVRREMEAARGRLDGYPGDVLTVTYEEMVGLPRLDSGQAGQGTANRMAVDQAHRIEEFLGVRRTVLPVALACDFPVPMSQWFSNWKEIRAALEKAGFGGLDG